MSTHGHLGGTWHWAMSSQRHSWLCTNEQHKNTGRWQKWIFWINNFCGNLSCVSESLLHFHPAVLRWFSSAWTRRRPGLWYRRSLCQSQLCSLLHKTSSPSPLKRWKNRSSSEYVLEWVRTQRPKQLTYTCCLTYETRILPFHGYFPFACLSGVHIIKDSSVVVWICATEDQLSAWRVFWVPEKINKSSIKSTFRVYRRMCSLRQLKPWFWGFLQVAASSLYWFKPVTSCL